MRKILSLVLALCMALALVPALAESAELTGAWYAATMSQGETTLELAALGMQMTLTLNEDGTATMDMSGEDLKEGTWKATDTGVDVTIDGSTVSGTLADGELSLAKDGQTILFNREAPKAIEFAEARTDTTLEEFNGTYEVAYVATGEAYIPADMAASLGMTLPKITIENGKLSAENLETDVAGIGTMLNLLGTQTMELKDGSLVLEITAEGVQGSTGINATLLKDGMLWMELLSNEEAVFTLYFNPVAEEAK